MSKKKYNGLIETLHIAAVPGLTESILKSAKEPLGSMANEDEPEW